MTIALAACAVYVLVSLVVGETFPFAKYSMYAGVRKEGAVPVFLADGVPSALEDYDAFTGIEPEAMYPKGLPCSLEWRVREAQRWIAEHRAQHPLDGGVPVQWGFRMVSVDDAGRARHEIKVVSEGRAARRC